MSSKSRRACPTETLPDPGVALSIGLPPLEAPLSPLRGRIDESDDRMFEACDYLMDILAAFFNVSGRELRSNRRCDLPVARVRQIAMYVMHVTLSTPMPRVGLAFGRDKTTVSYACHLIEDLRSHDDFDRVISRVEAIIRVAFSPTGRVF
ncbi:chromosomal replication initiator DnaA [Phyllobacterium sp. 21LDTY02-6]|uniref:helix-turn-helix domain-containing protein n=1 Tax=Phyllobacterium sp. 21LDTY02-6 TaxID=2944903 RepID=UPI002020144B|nr:helix-turn-helix domain-containing protein [Phyllobacterium sp. 21LDTY02-6]MCO4318373.1 chromosomal replication initiator DnaA [Phyllobacterium sp. 21LDTY02-6]